MKTHADLLREIGRLRASLETARNDALDEAAKAVAKVAAKHGDDIVAGALPFYAVLAIHDLKTTGDKST